MTDPAASTAPTRQPTALLTSIGVDAVQRPRTYRHGDRTVEARFAALALAQLLPDDETPTRVVVLATEQAATAGAVAAFRTDAEALGVPVDVVPIAGVHAPEELGPFYAAVAEALGAEKRVVLDVTQGLRHHAFLFYSLALYLRSLRGVALAGVWYAGATAKAEPDVHVLVDLRPAVDLAEWFYAVRLLRDHSATDAIVARLGDLRERLRRGENDDRRLASRLRDAAEALERFGAAYASALPLETGLAATKVVRRLEAIAGASLGHAIPLAADLVNQLREAVAPLAWPTPPPKSRKDAKWKTLLTWSEEEAERELRLVERYVHEQRAPAAAGALREWIVSLVAARRVGPEGARWLSRAERQRAERLLGQLKAFLREGDRGAADADDERKWAELWDAVTQLRNRILHQGMTEDEVDPMRALDAIKNLLAKACEARTWGLPRLGGGGVLLVSPQGQSPGVLYNALRAAQAAANGAALRAVVVCSAETRPTLETAAQHAGVPDAALVPVVVPDPFTVTRATLQEAVQRAQRDVRQADQVLVNLTGGTTAMGLVVQEIARSAEACGQPVRRFLLLDRRSPAEQRAHPWVPCDVEWLEELPDRG